MGIAKRRKPGSKVSRRIRRSPPAGAGPAKRRAVLARDLMTPAPITVPEQMTVGGLCDLLQERNINGAPVVDDKGKLVGVVTQEDIIYGAMGHPQFARGGSAAGERKTRGGKRVVAMLRDSGLRAAPPAEPQRGERPFWSDRHRPPDPMTMPVSTIMTSPAISADEDTPLADLCRIMWNLRIHRLPILRDGKVTGLVSSMDLCRAILDGTIRT